MEAGARLIVYPMLCFYNYCFIHLNHLPPFLIFSHCPLFLLTPIHPVFSLVTWLSLSQVSRALTAKCHLCVWSVCG